MRTARLVSSVGLALIVSGNVAWAQTPALQTVRVSVGGGRMPVIVAQQVGLFAKHGITVEFPTLPPGGSDSVRAALAGGDLDVVHSIVDNAVAVVELAGADVIIVAGGMGSPYELMAQPGNKTVRDLRGKTLIVDAPNTALAVQMKKILKVNGLDPDADCNLKPLATGAQRLVEMRGNKNYAAAMLGPPTSILARREGFVSLGSSTEQIGRLQGTSVYVRRQWAREHADLLQRYLAATIQAERWLMAPANKAAVIDIIAKDNDVSADVASETYDVGMGPGGWDADLRFDVEAFRNLLKLRAEVEGTWGGTPPSPARYYDPSYFESALSLANRR